MKSTSNYKTLHNTYLRAITSTLRPVMQCTNWASLLTRGATIWRDVTEWAWETWLEVNRCKEFLSWDFHHHSTLILALIRCYAHIHLLGPQRTVIVVNIRVHSRHDESAPFSSIFLKRATPVVVELSQPLAR